MKDALGHGRNSFKGILPTRPFRESVANELHSGTPKSAPAPVHDSMSVGDTVRAAGYNPMANTMAERRSSYNPDAVNKAIASSNRSGRRIGSKEASAIHRLLKGR